MDIKNIFLNQTTTCPECQGKDKECKVCGGSGAVIDSKVAEILKKHCPEINRVLLPKIMTEIYDHYQAKLVDSYDRGVRDGQAIKEEASKTETLDN